MRKYQVGGDCDCETGLGRSEERSINYKLSTLGFLFPGRRLFQNEDVVDEQKQTKADDWS